MPSKFKLIVFVSFTLFLISVPAPGYATVVPALPADPVVDLANIIDDNVEAKINNYLRELEQKTSAQIAILTIKSLEGQNLEEFAINIAHDKWRLGQKGKDNGLLLMVALNDRKYRIEVGYGLEGLLPDSLVGGIGRQHLVPNFRKGDYSSGIYAAAVIIANEIAKDAGIKITGLPKVKKNHSANKREGGAGPIGKIFSLLFFLILVIVFIRNPRSFFAFLLLSSMGGRRGYWGGSGGGFGGGGFGSFGGGGGGFGGGGASGSW